MVLSASHAAFVLRIRAGLSRNSTAALCPTHLQIRLSALERFASDVRLPTAKDFGLHDSD
jgi:hypothetical protein